MTNKVIFRQQTLELSNPLCFSLPRGQIDYEKIHAILNMLANTPCSRFELILVENLPILAKKVPIWGDLIPVRNLGSET